MATVDAILMGRKTFEKALTFGTWPYAEKPVFVLTSGELQAALPPGALVERMSGVPREIVSRLASRGIRHLYVDGGTTIQRFLRAGLIQHLIITRVPVLIGGGIPLFGALPHDLVLRHVRTRQYPSGLVQSEYAVSRPEAHAKDKTAVLEAVVPILSVTNLREALDYYERVLEFRIGWRWGEPPHLASARRDGVEVNLSEAQGVNPGASKLYVHVTGVDAYYNQICMACAKIAAPLADRPYGMRDFRIVDPSGNELSFGEATGS
jgi:dihydrofolate reductase/uncharacterized glyoxalase superfamily protein PhnB